MMIRNLEIRAADRLGYAIQNRDTYELLAVVPSLLGVEAVLKDIFAKGVSEGSADVVATKAESTERSSTFEPLPAAFPIATKLPGGKSYRSASADVIIAVPTEEGEREYGFLDEVAGNTAYTMLYIAGVNARITKSKDGFVGEPVLDQIDAAGEATDGSTMIYVVKTGTREDEERAVTVFYDEEVAKRVCEIVWAAGGSAQMRPAKLI